MRQLRQVAGRAHRPLARDDRQQALGQELQQAARQVGAHPRIPGGQRPGPQQQQRPHHVIAERFPHPRRVRPDDRGLQRGQVGLADRRVGQRAESRVHPVDGRAAAERLGNDGTAVLHPRRGVRREPRGRLAARDRHDVRHGEGAAIDDHFSHAHSLPRGGCGRGVRS